MSTNLTLALVLPEYFPYGGKQRDFLKIATAAVAAGHQVRALVGSWEGAVPEGIIVERLAVSGRTNHRRLICFANAVKANLSNNPADIVIGFTKIPGLDWYFAADTCYRARIQRRYGGWLDWLPRVRTLSSFESAVFANTSTTRILSLNPRERDVYRTLYASPNNRFVNLPPGVTEAFQVPTADQRKRLRESAGIADSDFLLLMVGSHFMTKGVDRSIAALAALPEALKKRCQLWVVGKGKDTPMRRLVDRHELDSQVKFLGGRDDVPTLMQTADLLLQPSRTELAGMSIVEGLASGLPVIASGVCGYSTHVMASNAGCVLMEPFCQRDLVLAMQLLLHPTELESARKNAAAYAEKNNLRALAINALDAIVASRSIPIGG
ncbi:MAG TPA: glycosyltransferase family 4 protein [Candidatus Kapabacteria bacterium]|nr:glycosyltransferase family 4 protein [Candidatus Kapabacteria bacterium]